MYKTILLSHTYSLVEIYVSHVRNSLTIHYLQWFIVGTCTSTVTLCDMADGQRM